MTQEQKTKVEATKLATAMVDMMESLTGVMDYEVDLLERQDYAGLNGLRLEKAKLVRDYQISIHRLSENPTMLKDAGTDLKLRLRDEGEKLDKASKRNASELESAITATQALVQTVMDSARSQITENNTYKDMRDVRQMASAYSPISQAIAVDQNV